MANIGKNIGEVSEFVSKDFEIAENESLIPAGNFKTLEEFKLYLTEKVRDLLDNKYDTLINILYRIDVPEDKLIKVLKDKRGEIIPAAIAELIIERSLQKVRLRQKYKTGEM